MDKRSGQESTACPECGAPLRDKDTWCPRCLAPLPVSEPPKVFAAPDEFVGPRLRIRYSRSARTDISFGPFGRMIATLLLVIGPLVFLLSYAAPFGIAYLVAACPILVPAIWKKTTVRQGTAPTDRIPG